MNEPIRHIIDIKTGKVYDLADDTKVEKVESKTLTSNDYTDEDKDYVKKLAATIAKLSSRIKFLEDNGSTLTYADSAEDVINIPEAALATTDLVLTSDEALEAMNESKTYRSINVVGANDTQSIYLNASSKIKIDNSTIGGGQGFVHGKVNFASPSLTAKNITVTGTVYNVFEGTQDTANISLASKNILFENVTTEPTILHNVLDVYTPTNDAVIKISNCNFDLDPRKSNILCIANFLNATGVTIEFENVNWTYENVGATDADFVETGLLTYQPGSLDIAVSGDTSCIATWSVILKNCKYNGELVTNTNFQKHNQVAFAWGVNGAMKEEDIVRYGISLVINDVPMLAIYKLSYVIDGVVWINEYHNVNDIITPIKKPEKIGYTFMGWQEEIPAVMTENDLTINGSFKANDYTLKYMFNNEEYSSLTYHYGETITPLEDPEVVEHFSGWKGLPENMKMPAENLTISGTTLIEYKITYIVDEKSYDVLNIEGETIKPFEGVEKDGYIFTGWDSELPTVMPDHDITVTAIWRKQTDYEKFITQTNKLLDIANNILNSGE